MKLDSLCADNDAKRGTGRNLSDIDDMMKHLVAYGSGMYLAIQGDGTLFKAGEYETAIDRMARDFSDQEINSSYVQGYYWDDWQSWTDLMAVYTISCFDHGIFVGLKKNGRTVAVGYNGEGQCDDINIWYGIRSVVSFHGNAIGLTYSGELLCSGKLKNNDIWATQKGVKKVCPGHKRVSILKETGAVTILEFDEGSFGNGSVFMREIENSLDGIVDIFAISDQTYAVHGDGRVSIVGDSEIDGRAIAACAGIKKIICEGSCVVALTAQKDGSLIPIGKIPTHFEGAKEWRDIVDVFSWSETLIGITSRREVRVTNRSDEFLDLGKGKKLPVWKREWGETIESWRDVVSIFNCGPLLAAVTTTGRLLFSGDVTEPSVRRFAKSGVITYSEEQYRMMCEQAEGMAKAEADHVAQERKIAEYRQRRVCQYCGGKFSGWIVKTCQECGKRKDY